MDEKQLGLKGNRKIFKTKNEDRVVLVEYAGVRKAKFVSKDKVRFNAMIDKVVEGDSGDTTAAEDFVKVVLLKEDGTICRRNTLTALHRDGVIVMRCPRAGAEDDSDSDSDDSD